MCGRAVVGMILRTRRRGCYFTLVLCTRCLHRPRQFSSTITLNSTKASRFSWDFSTKKKKWDGTWRFIILFICRLRRSLWEHISKELMNNIDIVVCSFSRVPLKDLEERREATRRRKNGTQQFLYLFSSSRKICFRVFYFPGEKTQHPTISSVSSTRRPC